MCVCVVLPVSGRILSIASHSKAKREKYDCIGNQAREETMYHFHGKCVIATCVKYLMGCFSDSFKVQVLNVFFDFFLYTRVYVRVYVQIILSCSNKKIFVCFFFSKLLFFHVRGCGFW